MIVLVQRRRGSWDRFYLGRIFGEFLVRTGLAGFPCLCEAKSNRSSLIDFRNRLDQFGLPAGVSCVFLLRVSRGCWLSLAPRSSSTPVAAWTSQEKLVEVHKWNWVHRPNSWIEFLSAPIHFPPPPSLVRRFGPSRETKVMKHPFCSIGPKMMFGSVSEHLVNLGHVKRCKTCVSGLNALFRSTEVVTHPF
jgi:hypothetical protein